MTKLAEWLRRTARSHPGGAGSFALHTLLILLAVTGLPSLFSKKAEDVPVVMVEMLPVRDITNVKPPEKKPEEKKEIKEKPKPPEPKPKAPQPKEKPQQDKKPEKKPDKRPEEKPKKKEAEPDDFDSVLKSVDAMKKSQKQSAPSDYDATKPLSISDLDAIRQQVYKHWLVLGGARDAKDTSVTIRLSLAQNGSVTSAEVADAPRYNSGDPVFRALAESALRAVYKASPFQGLPADKYGTWKELEMVFDPKDLLY